MRVFTTDEVQEAEQQALLRPGMSQPALIQRSGHAVTQFCLSRFKFRSVCVICATGRNGARGLVAAESLGEIAESVSVIVLAKDAGELDENTAVFCARLSRKPIWIATESDFQAAHVQQALRADLIIDAIAGDGQLPLGALQKTAVEAVNDAFGTIVSIDVPSGVDPDATLPFHQTEPDAVFAHGIITFVAPKPAHVFGELTSGPIALSEIGVQPVLVSNKSELQVITGQEVGMAFPSRSPNAHEGSFGHVLVIAGSAGKAGAAALTGMAALRTGAGLVTIACPKSIQATVAGFDPELMTEGLPETETGSIGSSAGDVIDKLMPGKDVVVLGPGLSQHLETAQLVRDLVGRCTLPLILNADGINAFAGRAGELNRENAQRAFRVLTPHPEEAARLLGISASDVQDNRLSLARRMVTDTGSCVVLKGWRTLVAGASGETWINMTGNPALAKGGSGDVLSGMIGAALARQAAGSAPSQQIPVPEPEPQRSWMHEIYGTDSMEKVRKHRAEQLHSNAARGAAFLKDVSVVGAVYLHGMAGDMARDELHENTVVARDVMDTLSEAFHECELQMERGLFYLQK
jgi:hydroxyethylthiazole kinase-like uncharacterized protein yjeF